MECTIECNVPQKDRTSSSIARHSYLGVVPADRCLSIMPSCRSIYLNARLAVVLGLFSDPNVSGGVKT